VPHAAKRQSPASSAPKKIACDHFIQENVALFRQDARKMGVFFKKCVFFTISGLRSENALLGNLLACQNDGRRKTPLPTRPTFAHNLILATSATLKT
jgi:hypothetical protein